DFHKLTPVVLRRALAQARTVVCEPTLRIALDVPASTIGLVSAALARMGAAVGTPSLHGEFATFEPVLSAAQLRDLQRELAGLARGEGVLESEFAGYEPVKGDPPIRGGSR